MDWEKAYHILEEYIYWDKHTEQQDKEFLEERINMCDPVYRILQGATDETIKRAQARLRKETGYGEKHDQTKECKSKRKKTAKLSEGYPKGVISQSA